MAAWRQAVSLVAALVVVVTAYSPLRHQPDPMARGSAFGAPHPDPFLRGTWAHAYAQAEAHGKPLDIAALMAQLHVGTDAGAGAGAGYAVQNVSFASAAVPSGQITLNGALVTPDPLPSTPLRVVVLISGSGPNDRWESVPGTPLRVWYDVATSLAATGAFAVITYDKRECAFVPGLCAGYVACSSAHPPGSGCVQFSQYSVYDLASDAQQALAYAQQLLGTAARTDSAVLIGHSQGCSVAPVVANALQSAADPLQLQQLDVLLLMGGGVPLDVLLSGQGLVQTAYGSVQLQFWADQPVTNPNRAPNMAYWQNALALSECEAATAIQQLDLMRTGTVQPTDAAVICPFGFPWHGDAHLPAGTYCPGVCSTLGAFPPLTQGLVCSRTSPFGPPLNSSCLLQCQYGYGVMACWQPVFAASWLAVTENEYAFKALAAVRGRVLAVNSMSDLLVVPPAFFPLHTALMTLNGTGALTHTAVQLYQNLTHDLVPQYSAATNVYPPLLTALNEWLLS